MKSSATLTFSSRRHWPACIALAASVALLDQLVKYAVTAWMPYGKVIAITPFFNLVHVWNTGAAFSFLADAGGWQRYAFSALGIAVIAFLALLLLRGVASRAEASGYVLIMGGALGNVFDRVARGFVVDYLDFHWRGWHWPAFNVADSALTAGAALIIFAGLRSGSRKADRTG